MQQSNLHTIYQIVRMIQQQILCFSMSSIHKVKCFFSRLSDFEETLSASECHDSDVGEENEIDDLETLEGMSSPLREVNEEMVDVYGEENREICSIESDSNIEVQQGPESNEKDIDD